MTPKSHRLRTDPEVIIVNQASLFLQPRESLDRVVCQSRLEKTFGVKMDTLARM
jgi:hypothetical protein